MVPLEKTGWTHAITETHTKRIETMVPTWLALPRWDYCQRNTCIFLIWQIKLRYGYPFHPRSKTRALENQNGHCHFYHGSSHYLNYNLSDNIIIRQLVASEEEFQLQVTRKPRHLNVFEYTAAVTRWRDQGARVYPRVLPIKFHLCNVYHGSAYSGHLCRNRTSVKLNKLYMYILQVMHASRCARVVIWMCKKRKHQLSNIFSSETSRPATGGTSDPQQTI